MSDFYFRTEKLVVGYNGIPLISDIDISVDRGQILTLIGPNGSGKSTILKSITKHLKKLGGTVYIENGSIDSMTYKQMSTKVSVVLTDRLKPEMMTCWDMAATGRYPYTGNLGILTEEDNLKVEESMKLVHAWELKERDFMTLSDGQKQRVLLARAICQEPEIIVLDEPTSFLDIRHRLELLDILRKMAKEKNIVVVMSLHEIDLALKISDIIMCVKGDYITKYGDPEKIFTTETIVDLYDISKGSYNMHFGSVEFPKPAGEPDVFVIAGNGTGIYFYREMQKKGIPFYTGVLHENDIDYQVARDLAAEVVFESAFNHIGDAAFNKALELMKSCSRVIYTGAEFGEINQRNSQLIKAAKKMGKVYSEVCNKE